MCCVIGIRVSVCKNKYYVEKKASAYPRQLSQYSNAMQLYKKWNLSEFMHYLQSQNYHKLSDADFCLLSTENSTCTQTGFISLVFIPNQNFSIVIVYYLTRQFRQLFTTKILISIRKQYQHTSKILENHKNNYM